MQKEVPACFRGMSTSVPEVHALHELGPDFCLDGQVSLRETTASLSGPGRSAHSVESGAVLLSMAVVRVRHPCSFAWPTPSFVNEDQH